MFYLSKIAAEDPAIHNLDFKTIRFERLRGKSFFGYGLFNRYPLYYGPHIKVPKSFSLKKMLKEPAFNEKRVPLTFESIIKYHHSKFGPLTMAALRSIYKCIYEMLLNGYFEKTNLANLTLIKEDEKKLLAKYLFQTSLTSVRPQTTGDPGTSIRWHFDYIFPGGINWIVNFGEVSTRYDRRLCIREKNFSWDEPIPPSREHIGHMPFNRVMAIHANTYHAGAEFIKGKIQSRLVIFLRSGFGAVDDPQLLRDKFEEWKNAYNFKDLAKRFSIFYQ